MPILKLLWVLLVFSGLFYAAESRLNNSIETLKNGLEKDIDEIKTMLTKIEERLRKVENSTAESRGRKIGFSVVKDWIIAFCAVATLIVSIIALVKSNGG